MTVNQAVIELQKLSSEGKGEYPLVAFDDQKYSIITPLEGFCGGKWDDDEKEIDCDCEPHEINAFLASAFSMYDEYENPIRRGGQYGRK